MIDTRAIYRKSAKGQEAITSRVGGLSPKSRALLIMVDGTRTARELMERATTLGFDGAALLEELASAGYIEPANAAAATTMRAAPQAAPAASADAARAAPAAALAPSKLTEIKSLLGYYIRIHTGFFESRALNADLSKARTLVDVDACVNALAEKLSANDVGFAAEMRQKVSEILARSS